MIDWWVAALLNVATLAIGALLVWRLDPIRRLRETVALAERQRKLIDKQSELIDRQSAQITALLMRDKPTQQ